MTRSLDAAPPHGSPRESVEQQPDEGKPIYYRHGALRSSERLALAQMSGYSNPRRSEPVNGRGRSCTGGLRGVFDFNAESDDPGAANERASTRVVSRAFQALLSRVRLPLSAPLLALALTGCATPRYTTVYCLPHDQALPAEPPKVKDKLTGDASKDVGVLAGSAIRLRAWGEGLQSILEGCREPPH